MASTPKINHDTKPLVTSYDSSYECSLDHWLDVYWLVEEEYVSITETKSELIVLSGKS